MTEKSQQTNEENTKDVMNYVEPVEDSMSDNFQEPDTLDIEEQIQEEPKYLKNVGRPRMKKVSMAKRNSWVDESGKRYNLMVVVPFNRAGDTKWSETDLDDEARFARELKLTGEQKAYVYYDPTYGTQVTTRGWERVIKTKIVHIGHNFVVQDYPHILDYECGLGGMKGVRRYTIMVGQIAKVSNLNDFDDLWKRLSQLDEVDEDGEIKKQNVYSSKLADPDKEVDMSKFNPNVASVENSPKIVSPRGTNIKTELNETNLEADIE